MTVRINVMSGDITTVVADAIVNAANNSLLGGGGVDGAIHRAAGPHLLSECRSLKGCQTGEAKITKGYDLHAKYVIHTVGPVWRGGSHKEFELLRMAYENSLSVAIENSINSIAFPNISTGIYGFPKKEAASIAIEATMTFTDIHDSPDSILFVCHDTENFELYTSLL